MTCDCSTISWWLAGWRAIHFLACLLAVGLLAFHLLVAAPVLRERSGPSRWTAAWIVLSLSIALVSGIGWLLVLAGQMGDVTPMQALHGPVRNLVLYHTQFGAIWRLRSVFWLVAAVAAMLLLLRGRTIATPCAWICLLASACMLGTLAWAGHGVDGNGNAARFHVLVDMVHLIVGGIWPFGLAPFAIALFALRKDASPLRSDVASALTRRFSAVALSSVALLTASGIVNSCFMLPSVSSLWQSDYGRLLSLKVGVFAVMLILACKNRFSLKPRLASRLAVDRTTMRLGRNVCMEFLLGTAIVLIVALLGLLSPAAP